MAEKSIQLEEISGLLNIRKVEPNLEKTSVRVMQVHGSIWAQDVANKGGEGKEGICQRSCKKKKKNDLMGHLSSAEMNAIVDRKDMQP